MKSESCEIVHFEDDESGAGRPEQPWATTLVDVAEAAESVMAIAVGNKDCSDEYFAAPSKAAEAKQDEVEMADKSEAATTS